MIEFRDNINFLFDIYNWLIARSSSILSIIILLLLALVFYMYKRHTSLTQDLKQTHSKISAEIFNIKQGNINTASLTLFPKDTLSDKVNFKWRFRCHLVINPFSDFGENFAIRISSKDTILVEDQNGINLQLANIGGFNTVHLNKEYFNTSMINYYSTKFIIHTDSDATEINVDIINENVNGNYKFNLIK